MKLSICIPNYNRAELLRAGLTALARQASPEIEVVVNDDVSHEPIRPVIRYIKAKYPHLKLRYSTNQHNLGFDRNVLKTVSLAKGEYCWLLSNDDQILPKAIKTILQVIKNRPNLSLIMVNYLRYSILNRALPPAKLIGIKKNHIYHDANKFFFQENTDGYFPYLGQNCLTMSCNIFAKVDWNRALLRHRKEGIIGCNFVHTFLVPAVAFASPNIFFLSQPQLKYLAHNSAPWPNHIWLDYNMRLIPFLFRLGYNPGQLLALWLSNWQYILKESLLKNQLFNYWYHKMLSRHE